MAFDVYRAVGGSERTRIFTMKGIRIGFILALTVQTAVSLAGTARPTAGAAAGQRAAAPQLADAPPRGLGPLREYDRPGFHPDDRDTDELVAHWRDELFGADGTLNAGWCPARQHDQVTPADRAPGRADRRRRAVGHRRRVPLQTECPWANYAIFEARDASAAPGTSSATRASAPTRTCSPSATRSGRGTERCRSPMAPRSSTTSATPRRSTGSTATSASATGSSPRTGRARTATGT